MHLLLERAEKERERESEEEQISLLYRIFGKSDASSLILEVKRERRLGLRE